VNIQHPTSADPETGSMYIATSRGCRSERPVPGQEIDDPDDTTTTGTTFSELDEERSAALARSLPAAQTFISTARDEEVPLPAGRRWRLRDGILG